ncbi:MAG: hypothetical protein KME64_06415 [Scytonematopsis contorta HA4267-MV1]|nr:hypothetical protein [Scytonematopsis contorta HA4267-MV1]
MRRMREIGEIFFPFFFNDPSPVTNYQFPITNQQLPIINYQLPITNYQLPCTLLQTKVLIPS